MEHILDKTGLTYLWGKIKALFATKEESLENALNAAEVLPAFLDYEASNPIDDYPPKVYTEEDYDVDGMDSQVIWDENAKKFYLRISDGNNDAYYTKWHAGKCYEYDKTFPSYEFYDIGNRMVVMYDPDYQQQYTVSQEISNIFISNFSRQYNDLYGKPTIPAAQIQSDWNQTNTSSKDFIKNKPTIPSIEDSTRLLPTHIIPWEDDAESEDDYPPVAYTYSYLNSHSNITAYPCYIPFEGFYLRVEDSSTGSITYYSEWYAGESYGVGSYPSSDYYVRYKFYLDTSDSSNKKVVYINGDDDQTYTIISDTENVYERNPRILPITSVISTVPSQVNSTNHAISNYSEIVLCTANNQIYAKISNAYYTKWYDKTLNSVYYYDRRFYRSTTNNTDNTVNPALYYLVGTNTIYNYKTSSTYDVIDLRCQADWNQSTNTAQDYIKNKPTIPTTYDLLINSALLLCVPEGENFESTPAGVTLENSWGIEPMTTTYLDLTSNGQGVTGNIGIHLYWDDTFVTSSITQNTWNGHYLSDNYVRCPEATIVITTAANSSTKVYVEDDSGNQVEWMNPTIGTLKPNTTYVLSIQGNLAVMVESEGGRAYA